MSELFRESPEKFMSSSELIAKMNELMCERAYLDAYYKKQYNIDPLPIRPTWLTGSTRPTEFENLNTGTDLSGSARVAPKPG